MPTASAVLGDVIDAALNLSNKTYRGMEDLKEVSFFQVVSKSPLLCQRPSCR